ncbi:DUF317 domain-containing protein [Streptomyces sp. NPDC044948]|uniref:DUF317 domain-containing protein n=1 Tax=Streptomyces sp. NPDC044948 TaxID=3157092 RepID=UPI0033E72802
MPRVILTSPDQLAQLRSAPDPDPAEPWWTLRHAHHGDQRAWEITFDAQAPVEIIAAVTDTLTAPPNRRRRRSTRTIRCARQAGMLPATTMIAPHPRG